MHYPVHLYPWSQIMPLMFQAKAYVIELYNTWQALLSSASQKDEKEEGRKWKISPVCNDGKSKRDIGIAEIGTMVYPAKKRTKWTINKTFRQREKKKHTDDSRRYFGSRQHEPRYQWGRVGGRVGCGKHICDKTLCIDQVIFTHHQERSSKIVLKVLDFFFLSLV